VNLPLPNSLLQHWVRFWYAPGSPRNLAAARILFASTSLWVLVSRNFAGISGLPTEFWSAVPTSASWRYLDFAGHPSLELALEWAAGITLVCAMAGVLPRVSCFIAGILLYHLAPLETIIWTPNPYARGLTISVLALLTLAFSPSGDRWTLQFYRHRRQVAEASDYTWPIRLIQLFVAQIYFMSGFAKISHSGWRWASASNLRNWLLYFSEEDQVRVFHTLGPWLAERPLLCQIIGIGTLIFELVFITVLFSKTARRLLVPLAVVFHLGILLSMNLAFLNVPQLFVFVDWDIVATWVGGRGKTTDLSGGAARTASFTPSLEI
jgi:hypothetical protein